MIHLLGRGIYTFSEAERLTGVNAQRLRYWFLDYNAPSGPIHRGDYADLRSNGHLLSFLDLVDGLVVGKLRERGCPLQYLRKVHAALADEFQTRHPFSQQNLLTDGKRVFLDIADQFGEERLREVVSGQYAFVNVLKPYLDQLDYDRSTLLAVKWRIFEGVVLDPARRYGKPIVEAAGIPTCVLGAAYAANGKDAELVADWYAVSPEDVTVAIQFEQYLATKAA